MVTSQPLGADSVSARSDTLVSPSSRFSFLALLFAASPTFFAQLIDRLPAVTKARLLMALLGIIVLGLGMILLVILGGRYVRRLSRTDVAPTKPEQDDWYRKPLNPPPTTRDDDSGP